jgi:hypothetical protein
MSVKNQHEIHPDAEMLSAFAEQALGERERGEVLEHLAACGRCRQVIALASEAAGAEVAAWRRAPVRRRVWFRSWGLALAPLAAVAASAVVAIYVHERDVERAAEVARVERQQASEKAPMPLQAQVPATPPQAGPAKQPAPTERAGAARRAPVAEPSVTASAPPPEAANVPLASREEPAPPAAEAQGPDARFQGMTGAVFAPSGTSPDEKKESDAALYDEERKRQADAEMEARDKRLFAAKRKAPADGHGSSGGAAGSGAVGSSEQVVVTDQQLQTQPAPATSAGALMRLRAGQFSGLRAPDPVHLPSELPAVSIAHAGERMLAIDNTGALFFSEDSGANWEPVTKQWTGLAVLVRKNATPKPEEAAPPAAKRESPGDTSGSGTVSESDIVFELLNDQGQVWLSTDGKTWAAR